MVIEVVLGIAAICGAAFVFLREKRAERAEWETLRSRLKTAILDEELVPMKELSGSMLDRMTNDLVYGNSVRRWN